MKVNFVDLGSQYKTLRAEIHEELEKVMSTTSFVLGPAVRDFESAFAEFCGVSHCVGVASGADALTLALKAVGLKPGDEVITAANTFIATTNSIVHAGGVPVLVDMCAADYNIDVSLVESAITERTKAIIPVHLYGQPADMEPLLAIANKHGLKVVEDACQAHGALYKGTRTGGLGDAGCFSFYPGKNLGSYGEGGAITTNDPEVAERIKVYRDVGQSEKYVHPVVGYNSRLQSMQAAVLGVKLRHLPEENSRRRHAAGCYSEALSGTSLVLPATRDYAEHVWHLYVVQHERRDGLMAYLKEREIFCGIHYPVPIHMQEAYDGTKTVPPGAPVLSVAAGKLVSLPMHPFLTEEEIAFVADTIKAFEAAP